MCLEESYFLDFRKDSSVVPVFKSLHLKATAMLVFFLWLVVSVYVVGKLENDSIVDHLKNCGLFYF